MDNKIIANSIKSLRKKNGVSQEKLAEYLGVSFQAVSKYAFLEMALFVIISGQ